MTTDKSRINPLFAVPASTKSTSPLRSGPACQSAATKIGGYGGVAVAAWLLTAVARVDGDSVCRSRSEGASSGAFGECVQCAKHLWCAPGAVAGAVGELDDDTGRHERVDVSAGVAGGDAEFTLKR
jgi:hypothetical protein